MKRKFYALAKAENEATLNIYGDITSIKWFENDVSADSLVKQLDELTDVEKINVYINSYGGEVAEGLAIYNALRRHKAKIVTHCEGFACSIASVIFMAGDERIMSDSSLLMIHNAWTYASGNAEELRKQADDLEKITSASVTAYKAHSNLSEEEIKALMNAESWILPSEALEYGFATAIIETETAAASQNAKMRLLDIVKAYRAKAEKSADETDETDNDEPNDPETDPETDKEKPEESDNVEDEEEETDENGENSPENAPKTDDKDEGEETDGDEENAENKGKKAAEKLCGFFNAISKF